MLLAKNAEESALLRSRQRWYKKHLKDTFKIVKKIIYRVKEDICNRYM